MVAITWSKEECDKLIELKLQSPKLSNKEIADIMVRTFDKDYSRTLVALKVIALLEVCQNLIK